MLRHGNDWAGCSSTTIGGQREMGDIDRIFGHYVRTGKGNCLRTVAVSYMIRRVDPTSSNSEHHL
jgi:hypothetical protein